jgi:hypothetical protein
MPEPKPKTHRLHIEGDIPMAGDLDSQNDLYGKIKDALVALRKIVEAEGGTLTSTQQRIGSKKVIPPAPPSQSSITHTDPAPGTGLSSHPTEPIAGTAPKHRAA